MKGLFKQKDPIFRTFLYSVIFGITILILLTPFYLIGYWEIPIGIFVGISINATAYLLLYLSKEKEEMTHSVKATTIIQILRFVVVLITAMVFGYLEFFLHIKIANTFAIVGGYLIPLLIYFIIEFTGRKNND